MAADAPSHKFQVELKGIKLDAETVASIEAAMHRAVFGELARVDLQGDYTVHRIPKEWLGIWIDFGHTKVGGGIKPHPQPGPY